MIKLPSNAFKSKLWYDFNYGSDNEVDFINRYNDEIILLNTPVKPEFPEWVKYCFINSDGEWVNCTVDKETLLDTVSFVWSEKNIRLYHCTYTQIPWLEYIRNGREPKDCLIKLEDYRC